MFNVDIERETVPFQLHFVVLLRPSASCTLFKGLIEKRFGLTLTLSEQDETLFVEFFSAGLSVDRSDPYLNVPKVVHDLCDSHRSRLIHCRLSSVRY